MADPVRIDVLSDATNIIITSEMIENNVSSVIEIDQGQSIDFQDIDIENVDLKVEDGNLVLIFANGKTLIIQNFVSLAINGEFIDINFNGDAGFNGSQFLQRTIQRINGEQDTSNVNIPGSNISRGNAYESLDIEDIDGVEIPLTTIIAAQNTEPEPEPEPEFSVINGTNNKDTIKGSEGDDSINAKDGDDIIHARGGNDIINGGSGKDHIDAGDGNDTILWDNLDKLVKGGKGFDTLKTTDTSKHIDLSDKNIKEIENIDLSHSDSTLHVTSTDIEKVSDFDGLFVKGETGAQITASEFINRGENVTYEGAIYATYSTLKPDSPVLFVEIGLTLNGESVDSTAPKRSGEAEMTFITESAGYKNTVGFYNVDDDGNITNVQIGFENASLQGNGHITPGESVNMGTYSQGDAFQIFIIANGYNQNHQFRDIDTEVGSLKFVNSDGEDANIHDTGPLSLIHIDDSGHETVLNGPIYHTENDNLNADNERHALVTVTEDGESVRIQFEDLHNLGDGDFDDVVLDIHLDGASAEIAGESVNGGENGVGSYGIIDLSAVGGVNIVEQQETEYDENESVDDDGNSDLLEISIVLTQDDYDCSDVQNDDPNVIF
tara:strand:+ start:40940 stop:42760 length:1821 start_codon:yes stop_codon:yes gene_type:complete